MQAILFDFWPEGEIPALKSSSNVLYFCWLLSIFSWAFHFSLSQESQREIMFQNQEVKLKYRIVVYQVKELAGEIWCKSFHQMQMCIFYQRVLSLHWSSLLPFWKMARELQEVFCHCWRPFSLLTVDWHRYYRRSLL